MRDTASTRLRSIDALVRGMPRRADTAERVLVLGTGELARTLVNEVVCDRDRYRVVGVVGDVPDFEKPSWRCAVIGTLADLSHVLDTLRPDRIVVALDEWWSGCPIVPLVAARSRGIAVEAGTRFYERVTGRVALEFVRPDELVFLQHRTTSRTASLFARSMSLLVGVAALVLLAPVLVLVAIAIALDSGRPVFFVQERVGMHGVRFRIFKFRTMRPCVGHCSEWERDNGHRVTVVGRFLRKHRLDELPQLLNVVRGEMNLVGPRPLPPSSFETLSTIARNVSGTGIAIPGYALRTSVRPGITGWAQIRYGYANGIEEELEKLRFDLYYVRHASAALDARILLETLHVAALGRDRGIRRGQHASEAAGEPRARHPHWAA
jgi:lipopolysaccharide/colanic/teichoic acid biosynthesis glycosyltransferase